MFDKNRIQHSCGVLVISTLLATMPLSLLHTTKINAYASAAKTETSVIVEHMAEQNAQYVEYSAIHTATIANAGYTVRTSEITRPKVEVTRTSKVETVDTNTYTIDGNMTTELMASDFVHAVDDEQSDLKSKSASSTTYSFSEDELELFARLVYAEAGNQDETGKRLVAAVVLNRIESNHFPNNLYDVVYDEDQFSTASYLYDNNRVKPTQSEYDAIAAELAERTDYDVLFFRTKHYHTFGTPLYPYGDHYFSAW